MLFITSAVGVAHPEPVRSVDSRAMPMLKAQSNTPPRSQNLTHGAASIVDASDMAPARKAPTYLMDSLGLYLDRPMSQQDAASQTWNWESQKPRRHTYLDSRRFVGPSIKGNLELKVNLQMNLTSRIRSDGFPEGSIHIRASPLAMTTCPN